MIARVGLALSLGVRLWAQGGADIDFSAASRTVGAEPVIIDCGMGDAARRELAPILDLHAGGVGWSWSTADGAVLEGRAAESIDIWLGVPLSRLWDADAEGRLLRRVAWPGVSTKLVAAGGQFALVFSQRWVLAWSHGAIAEPPTKVEDLLWKPQFDQRVVLVEPHGAPELWQAWRDTLAAAFGDPKALAWLTRLDGRVLAYAPTVAAALEQVRGGAVSVLPIGAVVAVEGIASAVPADGAPRRSLGVALAAQPRPGATELLDRLLEPSVLVELATAGGCALLPPSAFEGPQALDLGQRTRTEMWWRAQVRGQGARLESLDAWLDVVLGLALLALVGGIYWSIRKRS